MTRKELDALKARIAERTDKSTDLDIIVNRVMVLPYGQLKKVLTDDVMAVLKKYGYTEQRS